MKSFSRSAERQSLAGARLRKHADYLRTYAAARKRQSASMSWFLAPQEPVGSDLTAASGPGPHSGPRVGLTAGKVLGRATERNRIKRRMREAVRLELESLSPEWSIVFNPRRKAQNCLFTELQAEVHRLFIRCANSSSCSSPGTNA